MTTYQFNSASEIVTYLDRLAVKLGRPPRVYVIAHKERPKDETLRLIQSSDVCVEKTAWEMLDDPTRYEWINR